MATIQDDVLVEQKNQNPLWEMIVKAKVGKSHVGDIFLNT